MSIHVHKENALCIHNTYSTWIVIMYRHRDYLEDGLRSLTMERDSVRSLMMWCMDHSDSADEVLCVVLTCVVYTHML